MTNKDSAGVSVHYTYVWSDCVKTVSFKVLTRKIGDNLGKLDARLLDLKSHFRFNLTCYMSWWRWMVSDSNKFVLIISEGRVGVGKQLVLRTASTYQLLVKASSWLHWDWLLTWNTYAGQANPGQMRSFTRNYVSWGRRAFNSSVASFFVWLVIGAITVIHALLDFARERVRHEFGSRWPDVMVSVRWWGTHNPTIWFMGAEPVKSWNSLRACFYGRVSSIWKEKLFTPIVFFYEQLNFRHACHLRYIWSTYFS